MIHSDFHPCKYEDENWEDNKEGRSGQTVTKVLNSNWWFRFEKLPKRVEEMTEFNQQTFKRLDVVN